MRADRLLALMMLLQTKGVTTAEKLATELEVSKRTIYRDVEALSMAGIPIYATGGPGGGYALVDSYRTTLTGLNKHEMQALFMLTIPGPLAELAGNQPLKTAVLKLTTALSTPQQEEMNQMRQRLHLDASGWFQAEEAVPHLATLQEAVWQDRQLHLRYRPRSGEVRQRTVSPYSLVAKAGTWYLVAATEKGLRVYRAARIETADLTNTYFVRPATFDLAHFWQAWVEDYKTTLLQYPVTLRVGPDLAPTLPLILGEHVRALLEQAPPDAQGWRMIDYTFERIEQAQAYILGMGTSVEVIAPLSLKERVIQLATDIVAHYQAQQEPGTC